MKVYDIGTEQTVYVGSIFFEHPVHLFSVSQLFEDPLDPKTMIFNFTRATVASAEPKPSSTDHGKSS